MDNEKYEEIENQSKKEVKLKSKMYNDNSELLEKREDEETTDAVMWGFVLGFIFFFILLIMIICFTH